MPAAGPDASSVAPATAPPAKVGPAVLKRQVTAMHVSWQAYRYTDKSSRQTIAIDKEQTQQTVVRNDGDQGRGLSDVTAMVNAQLGVFHGLRSMICLSVYRVC